MVLHELHHSAKGIHDLHNKQLSSGGPRKTSQCPPTVSDRNVTRNKVPGYPAGLLSLYFITSADSSFKEKGKKERIPKRRSMWYTRVPGTAGGTGLPEPSSCPFLHSLVTTSFFFQGIQQQA